MGTTRKWIVRLKINVINKLMAGIIACFIPTGLVSAIESPPYHLSRIGLMSIDDNISSNQQILGVVLGFRVSFAYYVEGEINLPVGGGTHDKDGVSRNYNIFNLAFYSAYRYMLRPDYYVKLKLGLAHTRTSITGINLTNDVSSNSTDGAGGAGLGIVYHINKHPVMLELEITTIDQGGIVLYSLGITYPF